MNWSHLAAGSAFLRFDLGNRMEVEPFRPKAKNGLRSHPFQSDRFPVLVSHFGVSAIAYADLNIASHLC